MYLKLENKNLDNIRKFARKEKKAKQAYLKNNENSSVSSAVKKTSVNAAVKGKSSINTSKGKAAAKSVKRNRKQIAEPSLDPNSNNNDKAFCVVSKMSWAEDQKLMLGTTWIQCDDCTSWLHEDCLPIGFEYDTTEEKFLCHKCKKDN
ncbi:hypothetical protein DPMN_071653 [Dreissena polymorpha]|uniref:Zinc finger PHD-type domain-containing protein n=1 Tax=Dreissena polymorpha TaxID=45954 RepID=A0A9D4BPU9_DREPO|nr:hypothetical protein DPMN_071653 [Dreissena polymorpha]